MRQSIRSKRHNGLELSGANRSPQSFSRFIHRRSTPYPGAGGVRSSELLAVIMIPEVQSHRNVPNAVLQFLSPLRLET